MTEAGDYVDYLSWEKNTRPRNSDTGEDEDSFVFQDYLWGAVEAVIGRNAEELGTEHTGQNATIRIQNHPAVLPGDRLSTTETVWYIESVAKVSPWELVVEVYSRDIIPGN